MCLEYQHQKHFRKNQECRHSRTSLGSPQETARKEDFSPPDSLISACLKNKAAYPFVFRDIRHKLPKIKNDRWTTVMRRFWRHQKHL